MTEQRTTERDTGARRDRRPAVMAITLVAILALGALIAWMPQSWWLSELPEAAPDADAGRPAEPVDAREVDPAFRRPSVAVDREAWRLEEERRADPAAEPDLHATQQLESQLDVLFQHSVALLAQGDFARAEQALSLVLEVLPDFPEAHVNRGFALYELGRYARAKIHFRTAIELNPGQANAYYGLAMVHEAEGDLAGALGGMRSFIHLAEGYDEHYLAKARSAIWEWDEQLATMRAQEAPSAPEQQGAADEQSLSGSDGR